MGKRTKSFKLKFSQKQRSFFVAQPVMMLLIVPEPRAGFGFRNFGYWSGPKMLALILNRMKNKYRVLNVYYIVKINVKT